MVSALGSGSKGPGSSPGRVIRVIKTLYSPSVSPHPGIEMGTSKLSEKPGG